MADEPENAAELQEEKEDKEIRTRIRWEIPDSIITRYATNVLVQRSDNEYTFSFFEVRLPFLLGSPEEQRKQMQALESVEATCVARVTVARDKLPEIIRAMQSLIPTSTSNEEGEDSGTENPE